MRELITAAGGRTLGLFSSRRAAEQAAQELLRVGVGRRRRDAIDSDEQRAVVGA